MRIPPCVILILITILTLAFGKVQQSQNRLMVDTVASTLAINSQVHLE